MARLTKKVVAALLDAARERQGMGQAALSREQREHLAKGIEWLEAKQRDRAEA